MQRWVCGFVCMSLLASSARGDDVPLAGGSVVRFASVAEARAILTADDAFTASLSRFDRQCRMKTDKEVTLSDWKAFVAQHARPFNDQEIETIRGSLERLRARLAAYSLPLPPVISVVRTTGEGEAGAD
jgi:hypothetical protein